MIDRERLLEQAREAEGRASSAGEDAVIWIEWKFDNWPVEHVAEKAAILAKEAAHHALTALALRDVIDCADDDGYRWEYLQKRFRSDASET